MQLISLALFECAIKKSVAKVIQEQDKINAINYFPVSDKDTGANFSMTLEEILYISSQDHDLNSYIQCVSELIFDNARGNSGIILSMWFNGMAKTNFTENKISLECLKKMFDNGCRYLVDNFSDIAPGTIISFLVDFNKALGKVLNLSKVDKLLDDNLQKTKADNPALKKYNVVDAGAFGITIFLEVFFKTIIKGKVSEFVHFPVINNSEIFGKKIDAEHEFSKAPTYRYCTEAVLSHSKINTSELKSILDESGDCNITLEQNDKIRFHTHTNNPQQLFKKLYHVAQVKKPKVEDMLRQYQGSLSLSDIALVTDSSADLPCAVKDKYQIHTIPLLLSFDDQQAIDGYTVQSEEFYNHLEAFDVYPKTSAPNQKLALNLLSLLAKSYKHVLVLTISSRMSSTFKNISSLTSSYNNVHVFDTKKNSGSHGWLVTHAAESIEAGNSINEILGSLEKYRALTSTSVCLSNIKAMIKSGRVSKVKGFLGGLLNLKPMASTDEDGKGVVLSKSFSRRGSLNSLVSLSEKMYKNKPFKRYCILHVNDEKNATIIANRISKKIGMDPEFIKPASVVIGIHAGQGAIAISVDQGD